MQINVIKKVEPGWTIEQVAAESIGLSWRKVFDDAAPEIKHVSKKLDEQKIFGQYFPLKKDLFNAFKYCPLQSIKLIIIGKDPYDTIVSIKDKQMPKEMGMAFSVRAEDKEIPATILNIYKEIKNDYPDFIIPKHGNLIPWAQQGVLLLNRCLTITPGKKHSQYPLWHGLLNRVFKAINVINPNTIVLMMGREAQSISNMLPDSFVQIETPYPDNYYFDKGFNGCGCFKTINDHLEKQKKIPIDWTL